MKIYKIKIKTVYPLPSPNNYSIGKINLPEIKKTATGLVLFISY